MVVVSIVLLGRGEGGGAEVVSFTRGCKARVVVSWTHLSGVLRANFQHPLFLLLPSLQAIELSEKKKLSATDRRSFAEVHYWRALAYERINDFSSARTDYDKACSMGLTEACEELKE